MFATLVLCLMLVFNDYLEKNADWLRWIALLGVLIAIAAEGRSSSQIREEASSGVAALIASAPWLKAWFAFWAAVFFAGAVFVTRNSIDLFNIIGGVRFLLISLSVLVGPVVVLTQRRKFKELGEQRDAI